MISYSKNTKAKHRKNSGTTDKRSKLSIYKVFIGTITFVEFVLTYFGLQHLGGESIPNGLLFPLSLALSFAMMFSAHYAGEALQHRQKKPTIIAFGLGGVFLLIIAYIRSAADGSFMLTLANIGFYGTIAFVSYLRAKNQPFFDKQDKVEKFSHEDAHIQSGIEVQETSHNDKEKMRIEDSEDYAANKAQKELDDINDSITQAEGIIASIDHYELQRANEIEDIQKEALMDCIRYNQD